MPVFVCVPVSLVNNPKDPANPAQVDEITAAISLCIDAQTNTLYAGFKEMIKYYHLSRPGATCTTLKTRALTGKKKRQRVGQQGELSIACHSHTFISISLTHETYHCVSCMFRVLMCPCVCVHVFIWSSHTCRSGVVSGDGAGRAEPVGGRELQRRAGHV